MTRLVRLVALTFLPVPLIHATVWAQNMPAPAPVPPPGAPPPTGSGSDALIVMLGVITLLIILGVMTKVYDLKRRRDAEAVALQARLSDALLIDRSLRGVTVTPTVRMPIWGRSPVTVDVSGDVPSPDVREMVLRKVRQEASYLGPNVEIEDKLLVLPPVPLARAG